MKTVYTCFCTDMIHEGHINIINAAKAYGEVIVGVLCDYQMIRYNRFPTVSFEERVRMVEEIEGVSKVVVQNQIMYDEILAELRPDYVIHGDNWRTGPMEAIRKNVVENLEKYGGELIEVGYTWNASVRKKEEIVREKLAMPEFRRGRLRKLIALCGIVKIIEVHSGLTGLIAERTVVENNGGLDQFDGMWISSLRFHGERKAGH